MKTIDNIARRVLHARLEKITAGSLFVLENGQARHFGRDTALTDLSATIEVHDARFYKSVLRRGTLGAAEAFMNGWWTCDDLVSLMRIMIRDLDVAYGMEGGLARVARALYGLRHRLRRNTQRGSRRNIREHYDLGNAFFRLWLDPTMTYSCGIYEGPESTLEEASVAKLDRICRKLDLGPSDRVLEIGTGWGSFALFAARRFGCHVTTTTISREQYELARDRVERAGLEDRITLLLEDYRDLTGTFDKIVSIEMIEAVGHDHHEAFLRKCQDLLRPHGEMLLQAITIADKSYRHAQRSVDFIKHYIFPGSCLPSVTRLCDVATAETDLRLAHLEDLTPHYARTLFDWRQQFLACLDEVHALGYPERFTRMWEFYLAYCEAGFDERHIGNVQAMFVRPGARRPLPLAAVPSVTAEMGE